jgi:hypothetical protein
MSGYYSLGKYLWVIYMNLMNVLRRVWFCLVELGGWIGWGLDLCVMIVVCDVGVMV